MADLQKYLSRLSGESRDPSLLLAWLPPDEEAPDAAVLEERLGGTGVHLEPYEDGLRATVEGSEHSEPMQLDILVRPTGDLADAHLEYTHLTQAEIDRAKQSRWTVGVRTTFGAEPLSDFHTQLRVLAALAPRALGVMDLNACTARSGAWLSDVTSVLAPPAPHNLFSIHMVFDRDRPVWLHSHGLSRCGTLELEMLDVPKADAQKMALLINTAAALFIERAAPKPDEVFEPGKEMPLVWLPWEDALEKVSPHSGGPKDRDASHGGASAVLFAPAKGLLGGKKYASPARYAPTLEKNPLLYISNMETARMALLARERMEVFGELERAHRGEEKWMFLVKLGLDRDDQPARREHLWFSVHSLSGDQVDATLLNQPYYIARLREGQRVKESLENLSDFAVLCARGKFGPDRVLELTRTHAASPHLN